MDKKKPINSRAKGQTAEREFAALVYDNLNVKLSRNLAQTRNGGHDLVPEPGQFGGVARIFDRFAIEVKRRAVAPKRADLERFWAQACQQAEVSDLVPVLAVRANGNKHWAVWVPLTLCGIHWDVSHGGIDYAVPLSFPAFCGIVRSLNNEF